MSPALASILLATSLAAGPAAGEAVHSIQLSNGLEGAIVESHANPFVALTAVVGAGSLDENEVSRGASHFLEHLLFHGAGDMSQAELYAAVDRMGAYNNASTRVDHTVFLMLAPSDRLEEAASIQSDMLFRSRLSDEAFESERGIVSEEIGKDRGREGYRVGVLLDAALYEGTPLAQPVLGSVEDIEGIDADRVRAYYRNRYVPANVTLLVVGDITPADLDAVLAATYGKAPPGEKPASRPFTWKPEGTFTTLPAEADATRIKIALSGPAVGSEDGVALSVLLDLWNRGRFSPDGRPPLPAGLRRVRGASVIELSGSVPDGETPRVFLDRVREDLERAAQARPGGDDVRRAVRQARVEEAGLLERPHYYGLMRADIIAAGELDAALHRIGALREVSPEDLGRVASDWLADAEIEAVAAGPDLERRTISLDPLPPAGAGGPEKSVAPRSEPRVVREVLDNGLVVLVEEDPSAHLAAFHLLARNRAVWEPEGREGIADLLHRMLPEGTEYRSAEEIETELADLGANLKVTDNPHIPYDDYYSSPEFSYVRLEVLAEDAAQALQLLADMVRHPSFPPEAFDRRKEELLQLARMSEGEARHRARMAYREALHGAGHPMARPPLGTAESIEAIDRDDLVAFHREYFAPSNLILSVVSALPASQVLGAVRQQFAGGKSARETPDFTPSRPSPDAPARHVVEVGREQTILYLGKLLEIDQGDWPAVVAANAVLSDRLAFRIREREGLAYMVGSSVQRGPWGAALTVTAGVSPDNVEKAEALVREEMARLPRGVNARELEAAVGSLRGRALMRRMPSISRAWYLGLAEMEGRAPGADLRILERLGRITPREARKAARAYLEPDGLVVIEAR